MNKVFLIFLSLISVIIIIVSAMMVFGQIFQYGPTSSQTNVPSSVGLSTNVYPLYVVLLDTNDTFARYLGISINEPLPSGFWTTNNYTCEYIVGTPGSLYICLSNQSIQYFEVGISSDAGYMWNFSVILPNGIGYLCLNMDRHKVCTPNNSIKFYIPLDQLSLLLLSGEYELLYQYAGINSASS